MPQDAVPVHDSKDHWQERERKGRNGQLTHVIDGAPVKGDVSLFLNCT